jgi:deazaflavin-dependent oxidoreductase (nitroreductase family)
MGRAPVLLLHHVGRRSRTARVTPVLFLPDGQRLVIVGSKGGARRHPAWFSNLMAHPETTVEVARRRIPVRARMATDSERHRYWDRLVEMYPSFALYQERTERALPVVVLEPRNPP